MTITQTKVFIEGDLVGTLIVDDGNQAFLHYVMAGSNQAPDYLDQQEKFDVMIADVREWCESQQEEVHLMMY